MSGNEHRFSIRTFVLLGLLLIAAALLIQRRAMARDPEPVDIPPVSQAQSPSVMTLPEVPTGRPSERGPRVVMMEVTAYCPCKKCCGPKAQGITASGHRVSYNKGAFVAADTRILPFYTKVSVPGYRSGKAVPVIDRGGDIKGYRLDVFFYSHEEARQFGRQILPVTIYE